ncbi:MAG: thioesterase II family protein [Cyanomargarita calcarea GSE-NOS-MK-12-04C]|jgi:medium-chain acyl-[acyl-carrier-protein] hydrolase|uniref:Thioesterase II family protein n=1 Tax=Cyanomargarita calcarea GSE-NOS-MK-12-04C TaxID=2839659 RepID=A0A951QHL6_9CYAN|nr:thioesterase II family protein [Cyanomargarita calcarea GSE-NOS-MK-12-04C]
MKTAHQLNSWITCPKPNPQSDLRLFCFPYAGGSSLIFRTWASSLPQNIEVCPVELPGRGGQMKSPPFRQMEPLVKAIAPIILPYLDKPFAFFGHSMGGLLSFELACYLRQEYGKQPSHLCVSATRAPQIPSRKPPIHALPQAEFIQELHRLNGTPASVLENSELMQLLIPLLRADFALLETYTCIQQLPLECPITAFGGLEDQEVNIQELEGWRSQTQNSFQLEMFSGDHFFINSAQSLLLENLSEYLRSTVLHS